MLPEETLTALTRTWYEIPGTKFESVADIPVWSSDLQFVLVSQLVVVGSFAQIRVWYDDAPVTAVQETASELLFAPVEAWRF